MVNSRDSIDLTLPRRRAAAAGVEWRIAAEPVAYPDAVALMEARAAAIAAGEAAELVWLVEHPPLYTAGTSSKAADLLVRDESGREVVRRQLEDLKDFTNSVAWFGVSVRGYNRFNKKLDAKKADNGYARPKGVVRLENMRYRQP